MWVNDALEIPQKRGEEWWKLESCDGVDLSVIISKKRRGKHPYSFPLWRSIRSFFRKARQSSLPFPEGRDHGPSYYTMVDWTFINYICSFILDEKRMKSGFYNGEKRIVLLFEKRRKHRPFSYLLGKIEAHSFFFSNGTEENCPFTFLNEKNFTFFSTIKGNVSKKYEKIKFPPKCKVLKYSGFLLNNKLLYGFLSLWKRNNFFPWFCWTPIN